MSTHTLGYEAVGVAQLLEGLDKLPDDGGPCQAAPAAQHGKVRVGVGRLEPEQSYPQK